MAKKPKAQEPKSQEQARSDRDLADAVRDAAEQIWLAGLGAFAKARGGSTKSFEALVREGEALQRRTRTAAGDRVDEAGSYGAKSGLPASQSAPTCDRLEQVFEDRVARALARLGVPSASDIRDLTVLLEALTDRMATLDTKPTGTSAVAGQARSPARKPKGPNAIKANAASRTAPPGKP